MPKLAEAALLAVGNIIAIENSVDFESKAVDGLRCLVQCGDGFVSVKLKTEVANTIKPTVGMPVAWFVRPGASGGGDRGASTYTSFVGPADANILDLIAQRVPRKQAA